MLYNMNKALTFRNLALALLLALGFQNVSAQVFWSESFSDQASATTNWVHGGTNAGVEVWTWSDDPLAGFAAPGVPAFDATSATDGYFFFNSDANGDGNAHDVTLTGTGNPADATGRSNVHLRFYSQYFYDNENGIFLGISVGGAPFAYAQLLTALPGGTIFQDWIDVDVSSVVDGQSDVVIQFRQVGDWEYHWKVDDVELYEYAAPTPNVTFRVNMSQETVNPAGVYIAGTFGGPTAMTDEGGGVWSYTTALAGGGYLYRFINGPTAYEDGLNLAACGVANGTLGGYDRALTVGTNDISLPSVCFNSCDPCVLSCVDNPNAIICDDFETYTVGNISPQSDHWIPWDLNDGAGNIVGAEVSTDFASNGTKSMKIKQDGAAGDDQLLQLGNQTSGRYSLTWKYYIPNGKATYFNIQGNENVPGETFANEVYFRVTGVVDQVAPTPVASGTFPFDQWFPVELIVDLDNNLAKLFINGSLLRAWAYTADFGAIDFYAADATYLAYVDEVEYIQLAPVVYNVDVCGSAVDLTQYFGQTPGSAQTTGLYDNTGATASGTDVAGSCWLESSLNTTMWYTFTGDGGTYHIETVPCNATNYIGTDQQDPGDTQMAIYTGDDCANLTEVGCNDDFFPTGDPDWRAAVDIETESGQNYYMLIDAFNFQGTVALGEFCIEITQLASITCADGAVGTYTVANGGFVCNLANLGNLVTLNTNEVVIPNEGPVYGMCWAISTSPIPQGVWPATATGFVGGTGVLQTPFVMGLVNDNDPFAYGQYYITPVVVGGATDTNPANGPSIFDVDASAGCFFNGESTLVTLMPPINDLSIDNFNVQPNSIDITVSGGLAEFLGDPSLYSFSWTGPGGFTASTEDISGLTVSGQYTVVITDPSGCVGAYQQNFDVLVDVNDPGSVKSLTLSPNPTRNTVMLNLSLAYSAEVRIDVVNTIGQVLQTLNVGKVDAISQPVNLDGLSDGTYFLRVTVDGDVTQRSVVLQR